MTETVSHETYCDAVNIPAHIAGQIEAKRQGRRKHVRHGGTLCCHCLERPPISKTDRMCRDCRANDRKARRLAASKELKRLRALEAQQYLAKGKDNGHQYAKDGPMPATEPRPRSHRGLSSDG